MPSTLPVLTPAEAAAWDRATEAAGVPPITLMENAGRGAATVIATRFGEALSRGALVACGTGNNGGDGWVIARTLHRLGTPVFVCPLPGTLSSLTDRQTALARIEGVREVPPDGPWPTVGLVVDALLGTGARGPLRDPARDLVSRLGDLHLPVVAIDGPTGLDLYDGVAHGPPPLRADLTITFGGYRRGHLLARDDVGTVVVLDIGLTAPSPEWPALVTDAGAAEMLPALAAESHKGTRGRVVVVGGAPGLSGALRLTARSVLCAGAGVVTAVAPAETVALLAGAEPDLLTLAHPLDLPLRPDLVAQLERADAVVIGPGLGRTDGRAGFVRGVLGVARRLVIDADALTVLAGSVDALAAAAGTRSVLLTPHAGEFRSLFPHLAAGMGVDPWSVAQAAAEAAQATLLLKGVPTVIATAGRAPLTIAAGNPGLATGGSGDALAGIAGALLAWQGRGGGGRLEPMPAGALAAQILGRAADLAAARHTARSLRPMDVIAALPDLWRSWDRLRSTPYRAHPPVLHELTAPHRV